MKLYKAIKYAGKTLVGSLALLMLPAVLTGCSNNEENGLYAADDSNIGLEIKPENDKTDYHNGLLKIGSAQTSTIFNVISTTRWIVEISDCEGSWCQIVYGDSKSDATGYIGEGTFTIDAAPNRSSNARECNVTVYAIESDGTHIPGKSVEIHLEQDRQSISVEYSGDVVSPYGTTAATEQTVTVKANQAWTVSSSYTWVKIIPGAGMDGDAFTPATGSSDEETVSFKISVDANPSTSTRYAEVTISSPTSAFTPQRLNITQEGSSDTFLVTPSEVSRIPYTGDVVEFQVYSPRESWTVSTMSGDWITFDRTSGEASNELVTVKATVAPNIGGKIREVAIVFTRSGDKGDTTILISQAADPSAQAPDSTPQVSDPWVGGNWTATSAIICAYFNSPEIPITGCGICIQPVGNPNEYREISGSIESDNKIVARVNNLTPNTEYEAWAYVNYTYDGQNYGSSGGKIRFTTADNNGQPGVTPGIGDNNPPSSN